MKKLKKGEFFVIFSKKRKKGTFSASRRELRLSMRDCSNMSFFLEESESTGVSICTFVIVKVSVFVLLY